MSRTIHKYVLQITDCQRVSMPRGATLLSAQFQNDKLCVWAIVEPSKICEDKIFYIYGTGNPFPDKDDCPEIYFGTVQQNGFVWHIFEGDPA